MANQTNYQSNIQELSNSYTRYLVSRTIANTKNDLLDVQVPADFSDALLENNVEINLYSLADNSLIFSDIVRNISGSIYVETLQYQDNSSRKLLYIDFAKVQGLQLPSGQYGVTLNFFSDEIGSYNDRVLKVNRISTSRTEVELKLTDLEQQQKLEDFSTPALPATIIVDVLKQIFNQSGSNEIVLPTSPVKIDSASLYQNFGSGSGEKLVQYGFDVDDGSRIGINTIAQNVLDEAYPIALKTVNDMITLSGSTRFTETELSQYVVDAIDVAYDTALADEAKNPQNYRFDLI
jgi:hypothetical protein